MTIIQSLQTAANVAQANTDTLLTTSAETKSSVQEVRDRADCILVAIEDLRTSARSEREDALANSETQANALQNLNVSTDAIHVAVSEILGYHRREPRRLGHTWEAGGTRVFTVIDVLGQELAMPEELCRTREVCSGALEFALTFPGS